jgi:hypothetical protein|tara:strand:- start:2054 stop:2326 length:273 start_codon:yes stop_codon:yes gene_type:complete
MVSSRKLRRKKERKERKQLKKEMKNSIQDLASASESLPSNCQTCGMYFDKSNQKAWSDWIVEVSEAGSVNLKCISCTPSYESRIEDLTGL